MDIDKIRELAGQKEAEWHGLFKRMDDDRKLLQLEPFIMSDKNNQPVPGVLHTTTNDPAMFGAWVNAELMATKETWVVSGEKLSDEVTAKFENWIKYRFLDSDKRLRKSGGVDLLPFLYEQACYRGREAVRCVTEDDGTLDLLAADTRYMVYDNDFDGLTWVAPWYWRTQSMVKQIYPDFTWNDTFPKRVKVQDYWWKEKIGNDFEVYNQVVIGGKDVGKNVHDEPQLTKYNYIPWVIETVPVGSFMQDEDNYRRKGESIFWLARNIIPYLNEILTVMRSMNFRSYMGAYTWDNEGELPESPGPGDITQKEQGSEGLLLVQMQNLEQATIRLFSILDQRLQAATRSRIEEGTLSFTMSAVGIKDMRAERDKLYLPRLTATALLKLGVQDMFTRQAIELGKPIEVNQQMFKMSDLKKGFRVTLEYDTKTPKDDVANWALFNAIGPGMSLESKLRSVIQVDNVDEEMALLHSEAAQAAEPAIFYYERAHEYIDLWAKTGLEMYFNMAFMMADKGAVLWRQLDTGGKTPDTSTPSVSGQSGAIMPALLGGAGGQQRTGTPTDR